MITSLHTRGIKACAAAATLLAFSAAGAATMSRDQYSAAKDQIEAAYKSDKAACDSQAGNAKDVCMEQAKGKEKVAKADLEYKYSGKDSDRGKVAMAQADADYAVSKERCDDQSGDAKDACVSQAKATYDKAKADAKMTKARTSTSGN